MKSLECAEGKTGSCDTAVSQLSCVIPSGRDGFRRPIDGRCAPEPAVDGRCALGFGFKVTDAKDTLVLRGVAAADVACDFTERGEYGLLTSGPLLKSEPARRARSAPSVDTIGTQLPLLAPATTQLAAPLSQNGYGFSATFPK